MNFFNGTGNNRLFRITPTKTKDLNICRGKESVFLLENGYLPLIIRKTTRQAYFSALEAYDGGHRLKLERFLVEKFKDTFNKFFKVYVQYV